jgi:hypothetical protein
LHCFIHSVVVFAIFMAGLAAAHAQASAPDAHVQTAPAATGTLRGHIADPTGALIPGAAINITDAAGTAVKTVVADAAGAYVANGLTPGSYIVTTNVDGFAPFTSQPIPLAAAQVKRVDIAMAIEAEQQSVVVTDESPIVNVEAGGNASAIVLKGKDLDALSDDPDELSNELTALAGPSAGPNGGQIYIDGFSGGQLPPKSAIREIRINQNPFSAEFDRLGYGRIEILTKPGTDKLHGQMFIQGNDKEFNTGNPFTSTIPSYYSYQFNGTVSGALSKKASFFASAEQRNTENVNAWSIPNAVMLENPLLPYDSVTNPYQDTVNYGVSLLNRRIRDNASARIDWQLGAKNTFTARYGFWSEGEHGDLNQGSLAIASTPDMNPSTHESNTDHTVQMSDAIILNDHAVNESRFQYERQNENHYPDSPDRTISVQGDFTAGGFSGQESRDHTTRLEFQNLTTLSHGAHAIKFGTRIRDSRDANLTDANFNGAFTFANYEAYLAMANGLAAGTKFDTLFEQGNGPASASITTGVESTLANVFDMALFAQDDWKFSPRLTLSGGMRWESQNYVSDHDDWAPRVSFAYALDGGTKDKKTKTVLRAGYGLFYDRFGSSSLLTINRYNIQQQIVLNDPKCNTAATSLGAIDMTTCASTGGSSTASVPVKYEVDGHYHSPYTGQAGASLERQLLPGTSVTVTYLRSLGVHQMNTRNANQGTSGTTTDVAGDYLYQFYPEAVFKQDQLIVSVNGKLSKTMNVMGSYTLARADTNGAGGSASNAYYLDQDYGRAGFVSRNMLFLMGNYAGRWGIRFNPFMVVQSGRPFNITLPTDTENNLFNQRPGLAAPSACGAKLQIGAAVEYVPTSFGCLDTTRTKDGLLRKGEKLLPINLGNGPAAVAVNLRISKAIGIGPKLASPTQTSGGPPPGGPPPGGGGPGGGGGRGGPGGGGPGGGLGPGGLGGGGGRGGPGGMFGPTNTGHKYSLNFSVQALNLFNDIDYGTPNGTVTGTLDPNTGLVVPGSQFGKSTNLAGGIFSTGSAARRVFVQAVFSF